MPRPRTPIGTFGEIYYERAPGGRSRAFARLRDHDGQLRRVQATAATQQAAARKLKELLAARAEQSVGQGELNMAGLAAVARLISPEVEDRLRQVRRLLGETRDARQAIPQ